jgi:hypothetical protein
VRAMYALHHHTFHICIRARRQKLPFVNQNLTKIKSFGRSRLVHLVANRDNIPPVHHTVRKRRRASPTRRRLEISSNVGDYASCTLTRQRSPASRINLHAPRVQSQTPTSSSFSLPEPSVSSTYTRRSTRFPLAEWHMRNRLNAQAHSSCNGQGSLARNRLSVPNGSPILTKYKLYNPMTL